ncbi:MAG TPA: (2Fe-2S)-binding protein [Bryobacteraceae bacterium]|nr:(2Fe-2S)-binding protein [Bryobacteraceae bacterium]
MKEKPELEPKRNRGVSRRGFIGRVGIGSGALTSGVLTEAAQGQTPAGVMGPGAVSISLTLNGKPVKLEVEPRVTLLDALRDRLDMTGAKKVCDRGTCGACTVLMDGKAVYACSILAVDAQGKQIQTVESLTANNPVVKAFVDNDAQQCGYCTPGFVMATTAFLKKNPNPSYEDVNTGLGGNLCRCGTYFDVRKAVLQAAKDVKGGKNG